MWFISSTKIGFNSVLQFLTEECQLTQVDPYNFYKTAAVSLEFWYKIYIMRAVWQL